MKAMQSLAHMTPMRRLLVINPNINPAVTARVRCVADAIVGPRTSVTVVNPIKGPFSIETPEDRDAAVPEVLDLVGTTLHHLPDACVFACFDDIALFETRAMTRIPVVGTCEAGIAATRTIADRFSILTTVHSAVPGIHRLLARYGAADICTVRAAGIGVAEAAGQSDDAEKRILVTIEQAIERDGAQAILLGSGGLTGMAAKLERQFSIPVIDGVAAAIKMAEGLAHLRMPPGQPQPD